MQEFICRLLHAIVIYDLNVIGLLTGFLGGLLITFFGLPSIGILNQGMYVEIQVTRQMRVFNWLASVGLIFVMVGFFVQLVPAVQAVK